LKSAVMQAIVVLEHKCLQVGAPVEPLIHGIIFMARRIEKIESWDELKQLFKEVVRQLLEKIDLHLTEEEFAHRVRSYISADFHKDLTLGNLAEAMRMQPVHLSRIFVRQMGLNFRDYLAQVRIREAKKLLANKGFSVAEVAVQVGYRDVAYFIRVFRRLVGITPGQFSRQQDSLTFNGNSKSFNHDNVPLGPRMPGEVNQTGQEGGNCGQIYPWRAEKNLRTALLSGDIEYTRRATKDFFLELINWVQEINGVKSGVIKLLVVLARKCQQNGVPVEDFLSGTLELCRKADRTQTYAQIRDFLEDGVRYLERRVIWHKNETCYAVEVLKEYIQSNYSQSLKLEELARLVHFSPGYLVRIFSRVTGSTPYEYLILTRIEKARELLLNTNLSLGEIAEIIGFQDTGHFITTFKKRTGLTPQKYISCPNKEFRE